MVDRFISIAQGAAGVLEEGCNTTGFYTDKIETCRPYVIVCTGGILMLHDTGQIQLDSVCEIIAQHGRIKAVHFVEGQQQHEETHHNRLLQIAQRFGFRKAVWRPVRAYGTPFNVTFAAARGLQVVSALAQDNLIRDPHHERREATNKLNDWFTRPASQSAPLDIQFRMGVFTPPPQTRMSMKEMLQDTRADTKFGFIGISAIYQYAPLAGHELPEAFVAFVKANAIEEVVFNNMPAEYTDPEARREVMAQFEVLPIFD